MVTWQTVDWTLREWVEDLLQQPRHDGAGRRIDGAFDGTGAATSTCPTP